MEFDLARMDAVLFDASFASCDAAKANAIFTDDVEFYHNESGFSVGAATSTLARFAHVWRLQDGTWRLARVLSLDHHAVDAVKSTAGAAGGGL